MNSVFDHGSFEPFPNKFNMAEYVLRHSERLADKIALTVLHPKHDENWTYSDLANAVGGVATGLRKMGLTAGDRILLRLGNTPDTPLAYLGAIAADLVPIPSSPQLTTREVNDLVQTLNPTLVFRDPALAGPDFAQTLTPEALREMYDLPPSKPLLGDPNRPAYIVSTSGTSGQPRGVEHAHRAIWARRMMVADWYDLMESDRLMHAGAFNWTYTMGTGLMDPWSVGATALIPAATMRIEDLPALLERSGATLFAAAPGVFRKAFFHRGPVHLTGLRHGLCAGEKLGDTTRQAWETSTDRPIFEAYGLSECSTFISSNPHSDTRPSAIGRPQSGRVVAIVDANGEPVPVGETGVIAVHQSDPGLMLGYVDAPHDTQSRMMNGWFLTGDLGRMHEDGQVTYLGRQDELMNAGGFRVSPLEVEQVLSSVPGVTAVAVTAIEVKPDTRVIMAFYTGSNLDDSSALREQSEQKLASYKQPREFVHVPELPVSRTGKLLRKELQNIWNALNDQT